MRAARPAARVGIAMIPSLAPCFAGALAPYAALVREEPEAPDALPGRALRDAATLRELVGRFGAAYPGADRRAVVSLWTQWYFAALIVPAVAALIRLDRALPLGLDEVRLDLRENGTPAAFLVAHDGVPAADGAARFAALVEGHVEPLVAQLSALFGVPRRVLWTNVAVLVDWTMREVEACGACRAGPLAECRALLAVRDRACGAANPLCGALRRTPCAAGTASGETSGMVCRRRVCCLRYKLPGVPSCGDLCPLDEGKRRADP